MKFYRFPENKITAVLFAPFLLALLLLSRDTMLTTVIVSVERAQFVTLGLMCLVGVAFLAVNRKSLKGIFTDRRLLLAVAVTVVFLIPMVIKKDWQLMYFSMLLCVYYSIFLSYFISVKELARYFVVMMAALGVYSVVANYLLRIPVDSGIWTVPSFTNSHGYLFHNFGLAIVPDTYVKIRNFGLFREPGVYQFFLLLALYLHNCVLSWKHNWQNWLINGILAATMLTTFATGGIIEMALFVAVLFLDRKLYQNKAVVAAVGILAAAAVAVGLYSLATRNVLYETLHNMLAKLFTAHGSTEVRLEAIWADLGIFLKHPIFGEKIATVMFSVDHNTTSSMLLYAIYGFVGGTVHVAAWVALIWQKERKLWVNLAMLVILFMSFNTQNLITDVFFWLFPMMALAERGLPLMDKWSKTV